MSMRMRCARAHAGHTVSRPLVLAAMLALVMSGGTLSGSAITVLPATFNGVIQGVDTDELYLQTPKESFLTFYIDKDTAIFKDGMPAGAGDLSQGDLAQIRAEVDRDANLYAVIIRCKTRW